MKRYAITGLAALTASLPLVGCGTAEEPTQDPSANPSVPTSVPTPKWFEGGLELAIGADDALEPAEGTTLTYTDGDGEQKTARLAFTGAETPRTLATLNGEAIRNEVAAERVDTGNGGFYDNLSVGTNQNAENAAYTQSELEDAVANLVGSADFVGENRFYAVLGKDADGNYNEFHSSGAIAGPGAVHQAFEELYECAANAGASGELGDVRVRVMQGHFDSSEASSYGAVMEAYDKNGSCVAQMLVGNDVDIGPIADRASKMAYGIAPNAAAEAYLSSD